MLPVYFPANKSVSDGTVSLLQEEKPTNTKAIKAIRVKLKNIFVSYIYNFKLLHI